MQQHFQYTELALGETESLDAPSGLCRDSVGRALQFDVCVQGSHLAARTVKMGADARCLLSRGLVQRQIV